MNLEAYLLKIFENKIQIIELQEIFSIASNLHTLNNKLHFLFNYILWHH